MRIHRAKPYFKIYRDGGRSTEDPTKIVVDSRNASLPYVNTFIKNSGYDDWIRLYGFGKIRFGYELPFGFSIESNFDLNRQFYERKQWSPVMLVYSYNEETGEYTWNMAAWQTTRSSLREDRNIDKGFNQQHFLRWEKSFGNHNFNSFIGYERLYSFGSTTWARRMDFTFDLPYLFAGDDGQQTNSGSATETGRKSYLGRLNYNYVEKYLLEFSGRYDGSPNFPPDTRWGFFPSVSLGWKIDRETFMDALPFITSLKLRFSHGLTGYDRAGNFQYLSTYSLQSSYIYSGETISPGIRTDGLPNTTITWEKMRTTNVGLDFILWNTLEGALEYFYRLRSDVLGRRSGSIPDVVGAIMPQENFEEYDNRGVELMLTHRNSIGKFNYSVEGNIAYQREKIVYVDQAEYASKEGYRTGNRIGRWSDTFWVYPTDGMFKSQEEIDNYGVDIDGRSNATIKPGDIKFIDYNGDGRITVEDRIIAGGGGVSGTPKIMFGMNLSAMWKGFDASVLLQGATLTNIDWNGCQNLMHPFWADNQPTTFMYYNNYTAENPWKEANTDKAIWPRFGDDNWNRAHPNWSRISDFWLSNGTYLRVKNVVLGYTLPALVTNRLNVDRVRFYVSAYNLKTFAKFTEIIDPEQYAAYYVSHPPTGNIQFGIDVSF